MCRACQAAGVEPVFADYQDDDPIGFVVSLNLHRRHLNEPQREMAAGRIATAKRGGDRTSKHSANWRNDRTEVEAAKLLNVSERGVSRAKQVIRNGIPELTARVESGQIRVSTAADIATLPPGQQDIIVGLGQKAISAGKAADAKKEDNLKRGSEGQIRPSVKTNKESANKFEVSERTVRRAKQVKSRIRLLLMLLKSPEKRLQSANLPTEISNLT